MGMFDTLRDKGADALDRVNDARSNSKFFGAGADSFGTALKNMFGTGRNVADGGKSAGAKVVVGTAKGADTVAGTVLKDTSDFAAKHSFIALATVAVIAWKVVPAIFKRHQAKKELKHEEQVSQALTIAEQKLAERTAYASRTNNPSAPEDGRVLAGLNARNAGMGVPRT